MKPLVLYSKIPVIYEILLAILFTVIMVCTLGLGWIFYTMFLEHRYYLNRKVFLKHISHKDFKLPELIPLQIDSSIFEFTIDGYCIWIYFKTSNITVSSLDHLNEIGLFKSSFIDTIQVNKIINRINYLRY